MWTPIIFKEHHNITCVCMSASDVRVTRISCHLVCVYDYSHLQDIPARFSTIFQLYRTTDSSIFALTTKFRSRPVKQYNNNNHTCMLNENSQARTEIYVVDFCYGQGFLFLYMLYSKPSKHIVGRIPMRLQPRSTGLCALNAFLYTV